MKTPLNFFGGSAHGLYGNQVLHTEPENRHYSKCPLAMQFVQTTLKSAIAMKSDAEILRFASDQVKVDGLFIELGTYKGRSTNFLAALNPHKIIYTFDSYKGLPKSWDRGNLTASKGLFSWPEEEPLPHFLLNVELKMGWFSETLPRFVELQEEPIAFIHVDCDIYESCLEALNILGEKMVDGTLLLFDEFYNYPNYKNHEYRAFQEFLDKFSFSPEYLAFNENHEQVAVQLKRK